MCNIFHKIFYKFLYFFPVAVLNWFRCAQCVCKHYLKEIIYNEQTQKKHFLRKAWLCLIGRWCFRRTWKYLEISISCCKVWWRNLFTCLYHTGINLRLHFDHGGDFSWTYDKEKSCWSIWKLWKIPFYILWRMDQCDHSNPYCSLLFCHWRMGHQIPDRVFFWT